ncbi:MAG: hypothetical protein CL868_14630 [Cytophagaceae bacterium]|nr:hypothetical protein [Cytophagaceae bacterium]
MESSKYLNDIAEIKKMMSHSSRFLSLSGLSGILAGVYALIAAFMAHQKLGGFEKSQNAMSRFLYSVDIVGDLILIGLITLILAITTALILTLKKTRKTGEKIWTPISRRLIGSFAIPFVAGGFFCFVLLQNEIVGLVAPATLIFYGLALINASKYTLGDIKYLGLVNVILGLVATQFIGYGLYFWALGFGVSHIIYGAIMYNKYDRRAN